MKQPASEKQIAEVIELLVKSPIPPLYQEELMNSIHLLDEDQAQTILVALRDLHQKGAAYADKAVDWMATWKKIGDRIQTRLKSEAQIIEEELVAELTEDDDSAG
ncbi:MAG: hypothetical protein GX589_00275 [Deltaproteobacteria bacterium]|nr:hypothetical protein [Deltaproteobacteria bacterium]